MMNLNFLLRVGALIGSMLCFATAGYVYKINKDVRKMQKINDTLSEYLKSKHFLRMKNKGKSPETSTYNFNMCDFSQEGKIILGSKTE